MCCMGWIVYHYALYTTYYRAGTHHTVLAVPSRSLSPSCHCYRAPAGGGSWVVQRAYFGRRVGQGRFGLTRALESSGVGHLGEFLEGVLSGQ